MQSRCKLITTEHAMMRLLLSMKYSGFAERLDMCTLLVTANREEHSLYDGPKCGSFLSKSAE